jgi:hypothetical protein
MSVQQEFEVVDLILAVIALAAAMGVRLSEASATLGHRSSQTTASYLRNAQDKTSGAAQDGRQSVTEQLQERLSRAVVEGEPAANGESPYLGPVAATWPQGTPEASPLTRVHADMGRTEALAAHLSSLNAQLDEKM